MSDNFAVAPKERMLSLLSMLECNRGPKAYTFYDTFESAVTGRNGLMGKIEIII
jgi:hypothetical protein